MHRLYLYFVMVSRNDRKTSGWVVVQTSTRFKKSAASLESIKCSERIRSRTARWLIVLLMIEVFSQEMFSD
jgi:hypothetical protein